MTIPQGYISMNKKPSLKEILIRSFNTAFPIREILPTNVKFLYDGLIGNKRKHTELDLDKDTLNALRLAYNDSRKVNPRVITYENYPMFNSKGEWLPQSYEDSGIGLFVNTLFSPGYRASSTLGNINNIYKNKNGHVILKDKYDFDNISDEDYKRMNPVYRNVHRFAEKYSKPYDVEIDLGNPEKDWSYD